MRAARATAAMRCVNVACRRAALRLGQGLHRDDQAPPCNGQAPSRGHPGSSGVAPSRRDGRTPVRKTSDDDVRARSSDRPQRTNVPTATPANAGRMQVRRPTRRCDCPWRATCSSTARRLQLVDRVRREASRIAAASWSVHRSDSRLRRSTGRNMTTSSSPVRGLVFCLARARAEGGRGGAN